MYLQKTAKFLLTLSVEKKLVMVLFSLSSTEFELLNGRMCFDETIQFVNQLLIRENSAGIVFLQNRKPVIIIDGMLRNLREIIHEAASISKFEFVQCQWPEVQIFHWYLTNIVTLKISEQTTR